MSNQPATIPPWWQRGPRLALVLLLLLAGLLLVGEYFLAAKLFTPTTSPSPPGRALAFALVGMILVTATAAAVLFIALLLPAPKRQALLTGRMVYLRTLMLASWPCSRRSSGWRRTGAPNGIGNRSGGNWKLAARR